jgi:hypothetical protein
VDLTAPHSSNFTGSWNYRGTASASGVPTITIPVLTVASSTTLQFSASASGAGLTTCYFEAHYIVN